MKKLIKGFSQYINECGCAGGGMLPEDESVDLGLDATGTGVKDQVDGSVLEDDETGEEGLEGGEGLEDLGGTEGAEGSTQINIGAKGETLKALLNKIKELSDSGISFEITISPEGEDAETETLVWDGDGDDFIDNLEIEGEEDEAGEEFGAEGEFGGEENADDDFGGEDDETGDDEGTEDEDSDDEGEEFNEGAKPKSFIKSFNSFTNISEGKKLSKKQAAFFGKKAKGTEVKKDDKKKDDKKKKVNETFKAGKTVGGVKVPAMEGPKTGGGAKKK